MIKETETVTIGWCDNGLADGKFAEGLMGVTLAAPNNGMKINYNNKWFVLYKQWF